MKLSTINPQPSSALEGPLDWLREKFVKNDKPKRDTSAFDALIRKYAGAVPPHYIKGMIHVESAFDPEAIGPNQEIGLMQFLPSTARELGYSPEQLKDPETAVAAGTRYLAKIVDGVISPNVRVPIDPVLKIKLAQFGYTAGPTFLKEILKRYGSNKTLLASPLNFDALVDSLRGNPLTDRFEKLVPNFLNSRKQVVGRYQYWAQRYAPDFGFRPEPELVRPSPLTPKTLAAGMGVLGLVAASVFLSRRERH